MRAHYMYPHLGHEVQSALGDSRGVERQQRRKPVAAVAGFGIRFGVRLAQRRLVFHFFLHFFPGVAGEVLG